MEEGRGTGWRLGGCGALTSVAPSNASLKIHPRSDIQGRNRPPGMFLFLAFGFGPWTLSMARPCHPHYVPVDRGPFFDRKVESSAKRCFSSRIARSIGEWRRCSSSEYIPVRIVVAPRPRRASRERLGRPISHSLLAPASRGTRFAFSGGTRPIGAPRPSPDSLATERSRKRRPSSVSFPRFGVRRLFRGVFCARPATS